MTAAGLYGRRVSAHAGDPAEYALPPYLGSLIVCEDLDSAGAGKAAALVKAAFGTLRPYGGAAYLGIDAGKLAGIVKQARLAPARIEPLGKDTALLVRPGALSGSADWTHNYADAANSVVSADRRVRLPLGLLWFGNGPPNDEVLPRHGHGPAPQVAGGRLFIEGRNMLRATDIYTGRLLWQRKLPDLGKFHDNTSHQPGAGEIGGNYVSLADAVYVVYGRKILQLDPRSGRTVRELSLPTGTGQGAHWGYIGVWQYVLVATCRPVTVPGMKDKKRPGAKDKPQPPPALEKAFAPVQYSSASRQLVVLDRRTGKVLWRRQARYNFRHNNIAIGAGKVFCIDGVSAAKKQALARRGAGLGDYKPTLMALDVRTGREIWSTNRDVFGTFLNYSAAHDVLLQAGSAYRDRARDESGAGMVTYRGKDGKVVWKDLARRYNGPCMLHGDTIITQGPAYSLLTGKARLRKHPLTGGPMPWAFTRNYGCNTAVASTHLITFRSAAAGFYDLTGEGGTGNFGGFKSGCTSNLIVAGGLLNAPEYTRTCSCRYQNQTSLAMVHDPSVEVWTFNALAWDTKPVRRVGINFAAPGDRRAPGGTLWLDWPSRGGPSPDLPVTVQPKTTRTFRYHSSRVAAKPHSGQLNWVAASGLAGVRAVTITLAKDAAPRKYTVRLHFAEVAGAKPGERVFDVAIQGKMVARGFDVAARAGGADRAVVAEFTGVEAAGQLKVVLTPKTGGGNKAEPILCGLEVAAEGW